MTDEFIEVFGIVAVSIMVVSYALEKRAPIFIAIFAIACLMAAFYAYLVGSYPFLVAESIWALIAFLRWKKAMQ
ncbi:MAG: hypothetical protein ACRBHB_06195 [Arenicella sp.]